LTTRLLSAVNTPSNRPVPATYNNADGVVGPNLNTSARRHTQLLGVIRLDDKWLGIG
jgi:hypothetical protein